MKKVPGVTSVRVSLNDGLTILDLAPENTVTLAQLRQIIKNNGFVSKDATVLARGTVSPDQRAFSVGGTNERLSPVEAPRRKGDAWELTTREPPKR